jgi:hypothetical protein
VPQNDTLRAQQRRQKEAKVHPESERELVAWLLTQKVADDEKEIVTCTAVAGDKRGGK